MESTNKKYLYVLTNSINIQYKRFKIGKHKGTLDELRSRYQTYIPDLRVLFFEQFNDTDKIEKIILDQFDEYRIVLESGRKSEWVEKIDCFEVIKFITTEKIKDQSITNDELNKLHDQIKTQNLKIDEQTEKINNLTKQHNTQIDKIIEQEYQLNKSKTFIENIRRSIKIFDTERTKNSSDKFFGNTELCSEDVKNNQHFGEKIIYESPVNIPPLPQPSYYRVYIKPDVTHQITYMKSDDIFDLQQKFFSNPFCDPRTNEILRLNGVRYKELEKICGKPLTDDQIKELLSNFKKNPKVHPLTNIPIILGSF